MSNTLERGRGLGKDATYKVLQ